MATTNHPDSAKSARAGQVSDLTEREGAKSQPRWQLTQPGDPTNVRQLASELNIAPVLANLLVQRGITSFEEARAFFTPDLDDLHDPYLMKDMEQAVNRIQHALQHNERILIYGDYDVDGTTAVAMLYSFLAQHTSNIDFYIPDRYTEGRPLLCWHGIRSRD